MNRKYGLITILGAPRWYIGNDREDKILFISPFENKDVYNEWIKYIKEKFYD